MPNTRDGTHEGDTAEKNKIVGEENGHKSEPARVYSSSGNIVMCLNRTNDGAVSDVQTTGYKQSENGTTIFFKYGGCRAGWGTRTKKKVF